MGRHSKPNKLPATSISVSVDLRDNLGKNKPASKTMNEFLTLVFFEWSSFKDLKIAAELWETNAKDAWKSLAEKRQKISELEGIIDQLTEKLDLANDGNLGEPHVNLSGRNEIPVVIPTNLPMLELKQKEVI